jgi:hypothetical protein
MPARAEPVFSITAKKRKKLPIFLIFSSPPHIPKIGGSGIGPSKGVWPFLGAGRFFVFYDSRCCGVEAMGISGFPDAWISGYVFVCF